MPKNTTAAQCWESGSCFHTVWILFATEHPNRTLSIDGNGMMISLMGQVAPRLMDLVMEAKGRPAEVKPKHLGDPAQRDNLYKARSNGVIDGDQDIYFRRQSLLLEVQKRPLSAAAVLGAVGWATWTMVSNSRRGSVPHMWIGVERSRAIADAAPEARRRTF
ncbi:hypothetical protein E4191_03510 [Paracoccus liaowanqingii]|uniref:Uncharacterized protein n=1 Tax=Paracoccus liaowanqingii TaxID=2560053 RepID=A0A4P7HIN8_9RHOB|nr:hypothetical protein [Paracoccus liaowanqingii]QBX33886.1 hypothetical protein E4191_03510 [Paracoccus liaowanqingii]